MTNTSSLNRLVRFRRDLHQIPELDRDLPKTLKYINHVLSGLNCLVFSPTRSSACAYFDFGREKTAAFRSDMDALPISERTFLPFMSLHENKMHACGHDGHMAMLLELAVRVDSLTEPPPCNLLLIFQPAEETSGGAEDICLSGILEKYNVSHIFGFHLWPGLPEGEIYTKSGPMLARSSELDVDIYGKSSHIARPSEGLDALYAQTLFIKSAYDMEKSELPPSELRLLRFGKAESGTVRNAISAKSKLLGSMRAFSDETFDYMKKRLFEIAAGTKKLTGCDIDIRLSKGYPPVINDDRLYEAVCSFLGPNAPHALDEPFMIAEDFSFYGKAVPALFFFLGAGDRPPLHSNDFNFSEEILLNGADFYTRLLGFEF